MNRRTFTSTLAALPAAPDARKFRVAVGAFTHESNSFNPAETTLRDFRSPDDLPSTATLDRLAASSSEIAGFIEGGRKAGFDLLPTVFYNATPKGAVSREAFETITGRLLQSLEKQKPLDGLLLALHGAMYTKEHPHADEEIVRRIRTRFPKPFPIFVTHDYHGNVSQGIVDLSTVLITYKQNPHLDTKDRGLQSAHLLARTLRGEVRPVQTVVRPSMIYNITFQNTYAAPYKPITDESVRLERENPKILAVSVPGGYQYNDVPSIGPAAIVVTDNDRDLAEREAKRLSDMLWATREQIRLSLPDARQAVAQAIKAQKTPVALFDTGDNIGGGSAGDSTFVLDELLKQKATGWVVVMYDPGAVKAAKGAGIEGKIDMPIGGKTDDVHGKPVRVRGVVRSLHSGRYIETAVRHGGGRYWNMGHSAVIEAEGSTPELANYLVVTNERSSPNSLHQLISLGIYPERQRILVAKGTIAPRAAYEPVAAEIVMVDTPGATAVNPARFTFTRPPKDMFGLR